MTGDIMKTNSKEKRDWKEYAFWNNQTNKLREYWKKCGESATTFKKVNALTTTLQNYYLNGNVPFPRNYQRDALWSLILTYMFGNNDAKKLDFCTNVVVYSRTYRKVFVNRIGKNLIVSLRIHATAKIPEPYKHSDVKVETVDNGDNDRIRYVIITIPNIYELTPHLPYKQPRRAGMFTDESVYNLMNNNSASDSRRPDEPKKPDLPVLEWAEKVKFYSEQYNEFMRTIADVNKKMEQYTKALQVEKDRLACLEAEQVKIINKLEKMRHNGNSDK